MTRAELYAVEMIQRDIDDRRQKAKELRDEAEATRSTSHFIERVLRSAPAGASFETKIAKAVALDDEIQKLEAKKARAMETIRKACEQLEAEDRYYILRRHALLWNTIQIAEDAGVTRRTVQRKLKKAVSEILARP